MNSTFAADTIIDEAVPADRITARLPHAPMHMRPILMAVRDWGCGWCTIPQDAGRFTVPDNRPNIVIIGDDLFEAKGPTAFHRKSLRRLAATADVGVIVACEALPELYTLAAGAAMLGRKNAILVETQPRWEGEWYDVLVGANPRLQMHLGTVKPEGRA